MALVLSIMIGALAGSGVYLILRADRFRVVLGLTLLSYGVNLFLFASGGVKVGRPPLLGMVDPSEAADPLPQALVLTAIVIGFGMTAWLIALCLRVVRDEPHVPGEEEES